MHFLRICILALGLSAAVGAAAVSAQETDEILFTVARPGYETEMYVYDVDRAWLTKLSSDTASNQDPSWSPDGKQIAFTVWSDATAEIYTLDIDSGAARNISNSPSTQEQFPVWSPDGTMIAFLSDQGSEFEGVLYLHVMDADGTNLRRLSDDRSQILDIQWSPDSREIAFFTRRLGGEDNSHKITIVDVQTGASRFLIDDPEVILFWPRWSPDGTKLLFTMGRPVSGHVYSELYIADLATNEITQVTHRRVSIMFPEWSPDGEQIAFVSNLDGDKTSEIYLMNADGSNLHRLTRQEGNETMPVWSPDGARIAFRSEDNDPQTDVTELYVVDVDGRHLKRLTYYNAWVGTIAWQPR